MIMHLLRPDFQHVLGAARSDHVEHLVACDPDHLRAGRISQKERRDNILCPQISIAEACGLVWNCTDTMPGIEFRSLCDCLTEQPQRQTYAAVAHALLAELKANDEVNAGADARIKRLYYQRDAMIEQLEKAIAVEEGYDLTDRLQRGRAAVAADKAIERWEERKLEDPPPVPATPIEELLRKVYRHCEALRAMEEEMAA
jgi:hypothetical protein